MTPIGQLLAHSGMRPDGSMAAEKTHLPTVPSTWGTGQAGSWGNGWRGAGSGASQLKYRAWYGQAFMQMRVPIHRCCVTRTSPSSVRKFAETGHTGTQGGSSHIMHGRGMKYCSPVADCIVKTWIQVWSWWR